MPTRRQQKVARVIKEAVSDGIANHLSDPRIVGLISVTKVEITPDLRRANVYLSVLAKDDTEQDRTFIAITHAKKRLQTLLAGRIKSRFCPVLNFRKDEQFKKTMDMINLIDQVADEFKETQEQIQ